jgi:hypothetical protein
MNSPIYAHSLPGQPPEKWQPLNEHLKAVAEKAGEFDLLFAGNIRVERVHERDYTV